MRIDAFAGPSVPFDDMDFLIEREPSNGRASKIKLAYFGLLTLVIFSVSIAILASVHGNGRRANSLAARLDKIDEEIRNRQPTELPPTEPTKVPTSTGAPTGPTSEPTKGPTDVPTTVPSQPTTGPTSPTVPPTVPPTVSPTVSPTVCEAVVDIDKFDCHPEGNATKERCQARGCCWDGSGERTTVGAAALAACFHPTKYFGYVEVSRHEGTDRTVVNLHRRTPSGLPGDIEYLTVDISNIDENAVRVRIFDQKNKRFEVPIPPLNVHTKRPSPTPNYAVKVDSDLRLQISRVSPAQVVFDTELSKMIYSDQLLQLSNRVPANFLYGLGEHRDVFRKPVDWKVYTMKNSDRAPVKNAPLYGTHPFYLMVEDDKANSHGVLLFNNNPMDIVLQPTPAVTYRTIGGIFDFFVYLGPSPSDVVRQHIGLVGKPDLPPYWGLGFHLSRWGYGSLAVTNATMHRTIDAGIPLDVQWNDIDSFKNWNDFTYDNSNFSQLPEFVNDLHAMGMHYVPIVDCGIDGAEKNGSYPPYDDAVAMDIFIKDREGKPFVGYVWNHMRLWPDFSNPKATDWWAKQLKLYMDVVPIDGAWIDMNEPANARDGSYDPTTEKWAQCPADSSLDHPPYVPGAPESLTEKTVCMSAQQFLGPHYDLHNMYAIFESKATKEALLAITGKRQFIISRASSTGQGVYGMHWTGDIYSEWDSMRWTIPSLMEFNMFGMPLVGADICGFNGNTTQELCARWQALGAFYPFSRNHNTEGAIDQDPVALGGVVVNATKYALGLRYSVLPYIYTQFYRATNYGDTVMRPLFFEFPEEQASYSVEEQFMLGPSLMVVPALRFGETNVTAYFPRGLWYGDDGLLINSKGQTKELDIPLDRIVLARRGGSVIAGHPVRQTTTAQRKELFELSVYLDEEKSATGELYWDDGESPNSLLLALYSLIEFNVKNGVLTTTVHAAEYTQNLKVSKVSVYGVDKRPSAVLVDGEQTKFDYDSDKLVVENLSLDLTMTNLIDWSSSS